MDRPGTGPKRICRDFYADPGSLFSPKLADWYREHVPTQYNAVRFPDSTHMLVSDSPEKFVEEVQAVLRQ